MTDHIVERRQLLRGAALLPLLALPGCAGGLGGFSLVEAVRRLLTLSSQRAFATLLQPGGFWDNEVARIALPDRIGSSGTLLSRVLTTQLVRDRLGRELNRAAERGAERAAPVVTQAITSMSIADAAAIVRGGPRAATTLLEGAMGGGLIGVMSPAIGDALRLASDDIVSQVLRSVTGYDVGGLARDVSEGANRAIFNAIGFEEAGIRANPQSTNDPVLIGVFSLLG